MTIRGEVFDKCDGFECYFGSVALYSHNGKDGEDVDTCLLSSILAGNCVHLVNFLSVRMIVMKRCDVFRGICLVCHVYAHLVLRCLCLLLDVWGHGLFWSSFLCSMLVCASTWDAWSSACIILFCAFMSPSGDVISGMCMVPDQLSWLSLYLILSFQIRYCF